MRKVLGLVFLLFAFNAYAEPPLIDCNGTGDALQSHRSPPTWTCAQLVSTTGSPSSGNITKFSGGSTITNAVAGTDYQAPISLTTTGSSGASTFSGNTLNIPVYTGSGGVTSFTGDGTLISNSASTGVVTATLANAGSYSIWGNNTGSSAAPGYQTSFHVSGTGEIDGTLGIGTTPPSSYGAVAAINLGTSGNIEYIGTSGFPSAFVFSPFANYFNSTNFIYNAPNFVCTESSYGAAGIQISSTQGSGNEAGVVFTMAAPCTFGSTIALTSELQSELHGTILESPTGGFEGGGTLNASALFQNGVQDYNAVGTGITASGPIISCATASSSTVGCVKVDNTTITAASGVISAVSPNLSTDLELPNFRAMVGKLKYNAQGTYHPTWACIGDSLTVSYHSYATQNLWASGSYCQNLVQILRNAGIPAISQNFIGDGGPSPDNKEIDDIRFNIGGWAQYTFLSATVSAGGTLFTATSSVTPATFTPTEPVDTCVLYYPIGPSLGAISYSVDSGGSTTVNINSGSTSFGSTTVSLGTLGSHTFNVGWVSGTGSFDGIDCYNSTVNQVRILTMGWGAAPAYTNGSHYGWNLTSSTAGYSPSASATVMAFNPAITTILLGNNDANAGVSASNFVSGITTIASAWSNSGAADIVLVTQNADNPAQGWASVVTQQALVAAEETYAVTNSIPYVDVYYRMYPWATSNGYGFQYTDGIHLIATGYVDIARDIAQLLLRSDGVGQNVSVTGSPTSGNLAIFSGASSITNATIGTGLTISGTTLNSNAEQTISFQPGLLSAVTGTKGVYGKFVKASTVDNIEASAITFTCVGNPTITLYECGTSSTCASSPVTIGSATVTTSGQVFDGTIASAAITAGDYVAWAISAGTCTSLDIAATAQIHSN